MVSAIAENDPVSPWWVLSRFADENFPLPVVEALRRIGHNVTTVADAGKAGQALTDKAILELALADQRRWSR